MIPHPIFFLAPFLLGIAGGLRTFVPGTVLLIAVRLDYLSLEGTFLGFLDAIFFLFAAIAMAVCELIVDKLAFAPNRTALLGLIGRIVSGLFCGVVLMAAIAGNSYLAMTVGAVCGLIGALVGTFGGFKLRTWLPSQIGLRDLFIAIAEDIVAIGLAVCSVCLSI